MNSLGSHFAKSRTPATMRFALALALALLATAISSQSASASLVSDTDAFVAKYNGKSVDYDGMYGYQCVDLFNFFNRDVVGGGFIGVSYAYQLWSAGASNNSYNHVAANQSAQKGDVAIYGSSLPGSGGAGHVAIVLGDAGANLSVFHQNWSGAYAHTQTISKNYLLGYLRPKRTGSSPEGNLDVASGVPGGVHVGGWSADRDDTGAAIPVHIYIGGPAGAAGAEGHAIGTGGYRPDVQQVLGLGTNHGFESWLPTGKRGNQQVCAYGINVGGGDNSLIGCKTVSIGEPNPIGHFDEASGQGGKVVVRGWAADPNDFGQAIAVHIYVGGPAGAAGAEGVAIDTGVERPDVHAALGIGNNHGFESEVKTSKRGSQQVCAYAINLSFGDNVGLGCETVTITDPPPPSPDADSSTPSAQAMGGIIHVVSVKLRSPRLLVRVACRFAPCSGSLTGRVSRKRFRLGYLHLQNGQEVTISKRLSSRLYRATKRGTLVVYMNGGEVGRFK